MLRRRRRRPQQPVNPFPPSRHNDERETKFWIIAAPILIVAVFGGALWLAIDQIRGVG